MNIKFLYNKESSVLWQCLFLFIVSLILAWAIYLCSDVIQFTYALEAYQNLQVIPVQRSLVDQNSTGNTTSGLSEFVGFEKDFSLQYPSNWTAQPKTNRFEKVDVTLFNPGKGIITVQNSPLPSYVTQIMKEEHVKQKDIEDRLESFFPSYLKTFSNTFASQGGSASEVEEPVYDKYTVDKHRAGSSLLTVQAGRSLVPLLFFQ